MENDLAAYLLGEWCCSLQKKRERKLLISATGTKDVFQLKSLVPLGDI